MQFYTKYASTNGVDTLLCCTELKNRLHSGTLQGFPFGLIPDNMGFHHGQILIETETDSYNGTPGLCPYKAS